MASTSAGRARRRLSAPPHTLIFSPVLGVAFHKYAYESVRAEEARRAVSKGERDSVRPRTTSPYYEPEY